MNTKTFIQTTPPGLGSETDDNDFQDLGLLKQDLFECLANIKAPGDFSLFGTLKDAPNPGLLLKNGGLVGLPLSDRDAAAIVGASHQAPFGKGEETVVDETVRKTWELSHSEFALINPAWEPYLETIVAKVSAGLGVDSTGKGVRAELYKMLLYDEGAMLKPHQDSEKAPRMFGTLVIALPSKHEGGEVRLSHAGKTSILKTSKSSAFGFSYLAWFSDVTHEVKPVVSGRRLVLTYNLIHTTLDCKCIGADSGKAMARLRTLCERWTSNVGNDTSLPTTLAFLFEHQYTDTSLCYNNLKGHDKQVASCLRQVCADSGLSFYLANVDKTVSGGCDDEFEGQCTAVMEVMEKVVDLEGSTIAEGLDFDEDYFMKEDPFDGLEPDDEDYSGFTGNEGVSTTHFYHHTAAILVPKSCKFDFLLGSVSNEYYSEGMKPKALKAMELLDNMTTELSSNPDSESTKTELSHICDTVTRQMTGWKARSYSRVSYTLSYAPFSDEVVARVIAITLELDKKEKFLAAYDVCSKKMPLGVFRSIGIALVRYDLESLLPKLKSQFEQMSGFADRLAAAEQIQAGLDHASKSSAANQTVFHDWLKSNINLAVSTLTLTSIEDGETLTKLSQQMSSQEIFDRALPSAKMNAKHTSFCMAYLVGMYNAGSSGKLPENVACTIFKDVLSDFLEDFTLAPLAQSFSTTNKRKPNSYGIQSAPLDNAIASVDRRNGSLLAELILHCLSLGLESELDRLTGQIMIDTLESPVNIFEDICLPTLKLLVRKSDEKNNVVQNPVVQRLFQMVLSAFVVQFVRAEPAAPKNWSQPLVPGYCTCKDCMDMNSFLAHPSQQVSRFRMGEGRRRHLESQAVRYGVKCDTDRSGSPHTLVITKTRDSHKKAHLAWKTRRADAKKHLNEFDQSTLRVLLSNWYDPIIALAIGKLLPDVRSLTMNKSLPPLGPNRNSSNRDPGPITKRKTPTEVIVPDDD